VRRKKQEQSAASSSPAPKQGCTNEFDATSALEGAQKKVDQKKDADYTDYTELKTDEMGH